MTVIDLVAGAALPSLERKPGGPDNWVERAGGLPPYIDRIAKHLHYERGFSISHAIATAVNTVKRWARMGKVAKYGSKEHVSPATVAKAIAAVAEWNAKRAAGKINLSDVGFYIIDLTEVNDEFVIDLAHETSYLRDQKCKYCAAPASTSILHSEGMAYVPACNNHIGKAKADAAACVPGDGVSDPSNIDGVYSIESGKKIDLTVIRAGADQFLHGILSSMDVKLLARRANSIEDPEKRGAARQRVLDLAGVDASEVIDLASTIAPRHPSGKATDGRRSYKDQGKWKHGHIPLNRAARESKAKGSPIAIKRLNRIYSGKKDAVASSSTSSTKKPAFREKDAKTVKIEDKSVKESAKSVSALRNTKFEDTRNTKPTTAKNRKEASKQSRKSSRATQAWDTIPSNLKTMRNGKRYVIAIFGGKQTITEWVGGVHDTTGSPLNKRKTQVTLTTADANNMSTAEIRQLLKNPRTSKQVLKVLNAALLKKDPGAKG